MRRNRTYTILLTCLLIVILATSFVTTVLAQGVVYYGSSASAVRQVQTKLKNWGYYGGNVDGIFGYKTEQAVRWFQSANGLAVDGKCGTQTLTAMGLYDLIDSGSGSSGSSSGSYDDNVYLLARCIYGEARGEPYTGQVAVAAVILNRVKDSGFPNSISGVIYQRGAFDAVADGQVNLTPNQNALNAAKDAMNGWDPTGGALYYYNPVTATNQWIRSREIIATFGNHVFCL